MTQPSDRAVREDCDGARLAQRIAARLDLNRASPLHLGVAVSGGGDSLALLHLLKGLSAEDPGLRLQVATVDHGLRAAAAEEARQVGVIAAGLGLPHQVLRWQGWAGQGNVQDQARRARYDLLGQWARRQGLSAVAVGHTADDLAETFLMRLARSAGVDGLSAMAERREIGGVAFLRPMLGITRAELRGYLRARGIVWVDDPSNEDRGFGRVRARDALAELQGVGLGAAAIGDAARNLAMARDALNHYAGQEARRLAQVEHGDIVLDRAGFAALPEEIARRLLQAAVLWISGNEYPPRRGALTGALSAAGQGRGATLMGVCLLTGPRRLRLCREPAAVADTTAEPGHPWDGRWLLEGPVTQGCKVRALGREGLKLCPDRKMAGLPARALAGYPSVWQGDKLVAAPHAGMANGWTARLLRRDDAFHSSLYSD